MRIATLILGILLGMALLLITFIGMVDNLRELQAAGMDGWSGGVFWLLLLAWAVGVAFVLPWPLVATLAFGTAGVIALVTSLKLPTNAETYGGVMVAWMLASGVLALFSGLGWLGKRRDQDHRRPV